MMFLAIIFGILLGMLGSSVIAIFLSDDFGFRRSFSGTLLIDQDEEKIVLQLSEDTDTLLKNEKVLLRVEKQEKAQK